MEINKINRASYTNYNMNSNMASNHTKNIVQSQNSLKDNLQLSTYATGKTPRVGFGIDKGTAAHTTIQVDNSTFEKIVNYSTQNPDCAWDEMGWDGNKKWVVIDGQRFEYELTKQEKEAFRRGSMTLLDYVQEEEEKRDEMESDKALQEVEIPIDNSSEMSQHPKVQDLAGNTKVMKMLTDLAKTPGGVKLYV